MSTSICRICREERNEEDIQELSCRHRFCSMCMLVYPGTLCPTRFCSGTRSKDVVVDEMAIMDDNTTQIILGSTSSFFRLEIGEKLKCEAVRKGHICVNIASLVLSHCRHRLCSDCLSEKLQISWDNKTSPHCPMLKCCNMLSPTEIQTIASRVPRFSKLCKNVLENLKPIELPFETKPTSTELLVECFVYGKEQNKKTIVLPKICWVVDAVNAIVQLLRITSNQSTSSLDVFIRRECVDKKRKYKYEKVLTEGKCSIKDAAWTDHTIIVIDAEKQILRNRDKN